MVLFLSRAIQNWHVFQEVLVIREYHVVKRMIMTQKNASVVFDILECDGIAK